MVSSGLPPNVITALVSAVGVLATLPTLYLFKLFGRKTILSVCSFIIAGSLFGLGLTLIYNLEGGKTTQVLSIAFILTFIIFYQFSIGPLLWIYMAEIMTEKGLSIGATVTWITTLNIGTFANEIID